MVTASDLRLPVGRPISLRLQSADVIHSFWVPMLGGKRDLNPQRRRPEGEGSDHNWLHFTIREPGVYRGQCAEFCGQAHSLMGVRVVAESEPDFQRWLADWRGSDSAAADGTAAQGAAQGAPPADTSGAAVDSARAAADSAAIARAGQPGRGGVARIELGRATFHSSTCVACHGIQETNAAGRVGPDLTLYGRRATVAGWLENTPESLERWITALGSVKPGARMPGVAEPGGGFPPTNLSEEQVRAVAEYLWSLGKGPEEGVPAQAGLWSWITTVDHKRIGIMYFVTSLVFLFVGGGGGWRR